MSDLLTAYEASEKFRRKSASTKQRERGPLEDIRASKLGKLPLKALAAKGARAVIEKWRETEGQARGPRAADVRVGLISKALSWGIEYGHATANPARGIQALHDTDRSDVIFLKKDLEAFETAARAARRKLLKKDEQEPEATPNIVLALLLVCYTGLRREDLCNLAWSEIQDNVIVVRPRKSLRRAQTARKSRKAPYAIIPITPELRAILRQCDLGEGKRGPWVLTSTRGGKYTPSGLTSSFIKIRDAAGLVDEQGRKKSLHDGRGTFVTHMRANGIPIEDIAKMVGWSTQDVEQVAKKYVHAERVALAWIERLNRNASGT
ncbi:MAG TPA: tyrosine-type recombinase/integrase [Terricaulis sp.]|nr:tyrosine-type recombinase/integrase [Terricaulis sp.]